jgi:hypothetical protein
MSEAQWAHFVSSHGKYEGTPVTLRHVRDRSTKLVEVPGVPLRVPTEKFVPEANARIQDAMAQLDRLEVC